MDDGGPRIQTVSPTQFGAQMATFVEIHREAMGYDPALVRGRDQIWLRHAQRAGFNCVAAVCASGQTIGFCYGYRGGPGQWWYEQVQRGMTPQARQQWLSSYVELTELHVQPQRQGRGLGERLLRAFLANRTEATVLLSTPEGDNRAWRLYRRLGFADVLRHYSFLGDARPFGILGRTLPLGEWFA